MSTTLISTYQKFHVEQRNLTIQCGDRLYEGRIFDLYDDFLELISCEKNIHAIKFDSIDVISWELG